MRFHGERYDCQIQITLDHPSALGVYPKAGFTKYDESRHRQTVLCTPLV